MNEIYKNDEPYGTVSRKISCKVYKEGVGLFVWQAPDDTSAADFIDTILHENQFYYAGTILGKVASGLFCVLKKKIREAISRF
jgi:hypothetical protein